MQYFEKHSIKAIYVSEYIRTPQTAQPLASKLNMVPVVDSRLNEIDIGVIDKLSENEIKEKYPEVWNSLQEGNRDFR